MLRLSLLLLLTACGLRSYQPPDGGDAGEGGGSATGGGGSATGGGGSATGGGGSATGGGGSATGGGGSATGGGGSATGGGGSATGGGGSATGGGGDATGGGGSATGGGGSATGGGGPFTGDGGAFSWSKRLTSPSAIGKFVGVRAFGRDDVWFAATGGGGFLDGVVFHFDGGSLAPVLTPVGGGSISDLEVAPLSGKVAVAQYDTIYECDARDGGCLNGNNWEAFGVGSPNDTVTGLCTDGRRFFGVGGTLSGQGAFFGGPGYARLAAPPSSIHSYYDCWVKPDGTVLATTEGELGWLSPDGGSRQVPVNPAGLSFASSVTWYAIHGAEDRVFLGGAAKELVELLPDAGAQLHFDSLSGGAGGFYAFGGRTSHELFAVGTYSLGTSTGRYDGLSWQRGVSLMSNVDVYAMTAVDDDTYWAVGLQLSASGASEGGQILYGHR